jgi:hypothetical protein
MALLSESRKNTIKGYTIILFVVGIIFIVVWSMNGNFQTQKDPEPNIVQATIIIESNVDWTGSVTITGSDYGFYPISGSMYDSGSADNKTYSYHYTANTVDLDVTASFQMNFLGQSIIISDGYLHAQVYINGTLEYDKRVNAFTPTCGFEFWYQAGYS